MAIEPLRLFLLSHPESAAGKVLATALMRRFVDPPASGGLRLPTRFTPDRGAGLPPPWEGADGINLDAAEHTIVVVLADARMVRTVAGGTGEAWRTFLGEGLRRAPQPASQHLVFGIAVDSAGFMLAENEHMIRVAQSPTISSGDEKANVRDLASWCAAVVDDAALQITVRAIQKLEPRAQPTLGRAPLKLFLSHAKADLSAIEDDPVRHVEHAVRELPIDYWFDAAEIPPSAEFESEISKGIQDCSIVVSFLTDQYSSRTWCQREVMDAKRLGVPVLVVDALDQGEPRHFPYIGNVPVVHWRASEPRQEAQRVVSHAARETLRYIHNRVKLQHFASPEDRVLASAPEAFTVAQISAIAQPKAFLYPDPPLARQELSVLQSLVPSATFTTPLTKMALSTRLDSHLIGISISSSADLSKHGLCELHEQTLADELCLYLLLSGCRIAYGGALTPQIKLASNFTLRLFELVRGYSGLVSTATGHGLHPIANYAAWPLRLSYDEQILNLFGNVATLLEGARPTEITQSDDELFPQDSAGIRDIGTDDPQQRLAWARGLTTMRKQMAGEITARLAIGGRVDGFSGLYPGIFEEAWMSLVSEKPLFLSGAFGGASDALIESIVSGDPSHILKHLKSADLVACTELAAAQGLSIVGAATNHAGLPDSNTLILGEKIASDLCSVRQNGIAASLKNGLTDAENSTLFAACDPSEIIELIFRGLSRIANRP